jgi:hypothetical protein
MANCACKLSNYSAMLLSLALHTAVVCAFCSLGPIAKKTVWVSLRPALSIPVEMQLDFNPAQSEENTEPTAAMSEQRGDYANGKEPQQSVLTAQPHTESPQVSGVAMPQNLPVPLPGNQPLWSFQTRTMANTQAAYQAQMHRQTSVELQNQASSARLKYEAFLKSALVGLKLQDACKVLLPLAARPQLQCTNESDSRQVNAVLDKLGFIPAMPRDAITCIEIDVVPNAGGRENSLKCTHAGDQSV